MLVEKITPGLGVFLTIVRLICTHCHIAPLVIGERTRTTPRHSVDSGLKLIGNFSTKGFGYR